MIIVPTSIDFSVIVFCFQAIFPGKELVLHRSRLASRVPRMMFVSKTPGALGQSAVRAHATATSIKMGGPARRKLVEIVGIHVSVVLLSGEIRTKILI